MFATTNYMESTQISHFPNTEASSSEWHSQIQGLQMDHHSGIFVLVLPSSFSKQTKHRSLSQEVYHPTTQDSSSSHKQSLSSCNKWGTEEGRLNCSSTINCSSPASTLPCSRLLQCHCCRGALLCTGAAVRLKQQRYLMGTTWQSCTTSKGVCGGERDV